MLLFVKTTKGHDVLAERDCNGKTGSRPCESSLLCVCLSLKSCVSA